MGNPGSPLRTEPIGQLLPRRLLFRGVVAGSCRVFPELPAPAFFSFGQARFVGIDVDVIGIDANE